MIFVTVGTNTYSFDRLIKEVDNIAKGLREKIIAQIGYTKYTPKNIEFFRFTNYEKILKLNEKADIIITHGGAGCAINALKNGKPTIVVPRYKKFKEHTNDHQLDLTRNLEKERRIIAVYDIKNLKKAIEKAKKFKMKRKKRSQIVETISKYISDLK